MGKQGRIDDVKKNEMDIGVWKSTRPLIGRNGTIFVNFDRSLWDHGPRIYFEPNSLTEGFSYFRYFLDDGLITCICSMLFHNMLFWHLLFILEGALFCRLVRVYTTFSINIFYYLLRFLRSRSFDILLSYFGFMHF